MKFESIKSATKKIVIDFVTCMIYGFAMCAGMYLFMKVLS
jgi:hypothetical protein